MALPVTLLISRAVRNEIGTVSVIYGQTMMIALGMNQLVKVLSGRPRPYVFNGNQAITPDMKMSSHAKKSFYSGHATMAFASVSFLANTYDAFYPESKFRPWIWSGGILLAGSVAALRVFGGVHYPSDVLVGALAGSLTGYLLPYFHQSNAAKSNQSMAVPQIWLKFRF